MTTAPAVLTALRAAFTGPGAPARITAGLLLLGTLAAQHPNLSFHRVPRKDRLNAAFPNWRFFAPHPAQHDFEICYRTLNEAGETSPWQPVEVIQGRRPGQIVWFPGRRPEKAVFDVGSEILQSLDKGFGVVTRQPAYRLLSAHLARHIAERGAGDVKGFQFTMVRVAGYDESEEPEIVFVSPYNPLPRPAGAGRAREGS
ncbi:hypothetical protein [Streptomyces harbinensis]|uniref:hypothetical protein n=1 Tax=Streptomyces harbinensis TaxID=1176198 RepID=UPI00339B0BCC